MNYKIIDDQRVIIFYKKCTTRRFKKLTGIKFPFFGKHKGKMLVPEGLWGRIAGFYLSNNGHLLPDGNKIDAEYIKD